MAAPAALLLLGFVLTPRASRADGPLPRVDTFAGSGVSGVADGPPALAQFVAPAGLAVANGHVYVADRGGQRVRDVAPDGSVRTLAGGGDPLGPALGVAGGYRDGPAATARFNQPLGVAAAADGSVYVADTKNHCIRLIRGGTVSTFAGSPLRRGKTDGPPALASFEQPRSLALASDGRLFVADYPNGVRVVAPDGSVSTFKLQLKTATANVTSLAIVAQAGADYLVAGSVTDLSVSSLRDGAPVIDLARGMPGVPADIAFGTVVGPPSAVAGLPTPAFPGPATMLFSDAFASSVVVCHFADCAFLGAPPSFDASRYGSGFRDGDATVAQFDQPEGIATAPDGTVYVADTGNKRIRRIAGVRATLPRMYYGQDVLSKFPPKRRPDAYRIAIVGNSAVDAVLPPELGPAANLERIVAPLVAAAGKHVEIYPLGIPALERDGALATIEQDFSAGLVDAVVLDLPHYFDFPVQPNAPRTVPENLGPQWLEQTRTGLRALTRKLAAQGIPLYVYAHPLPFEIPGETVYAQFPKSPPSPGPLVLLDDEADIPDPADVARVASAMASLARDPQLRFIDLYPLFFAEHASPANRALFNSWDDHFTPRAAQIVGKALGERLARDAPWNRR